MKILISIYPRIITYTCVYISMLFTPSSCIGQKPVTDEKWIGKTDVQKVQGELSWFQGSYKNYLPDTTAIKLLSPKINNYTYYAFGGIWCGDTKKLLPKFMKTLDQSHVSKDRITLYLLDHDKKSPDKLEKKYKVVNIPTFIILKDGKEIGRIVEKEKESIEKDLLKIVQ